MLVLGRTHALIGVSVSWALVVALGTGEQRVIWLLCGALGALLPDLDSPRSLLTGWQIVGLSPLQPLARLTHRTFGHRGALHSLLGWGVASCAFLSLGLLFPGACGPGVALSLGYLSHLLADGCTKTGIPLLYPRRQRYRLLPRALRLSTGSLAEEALFAILGAVFIAQLLVTLHSF
ncbi:inner membrane protein YdjM [Abditibacteriota bacterium]|nr:inner membrane protein YdjM [Abditibacteriota bacterium]